MKEATGEGSMTIITIVIIVALAAAAAIVVGIMMNRAKGEANKAGSDIGTNINSEFNKETTNGSGTTLEG